MMRFDARVEVLKRLKEKGLSRGEADNPMAIPKCSRTVRHATLAGSALPHLLRAARVGSAIF